MIDPRVPARGGANPLQLKTTDKLKLGEKPSWTWGPL